MIDLTPESMMIDLTPESMTPESPNRPAYREGGHTQTAIAQTTGLSVSRISRLIATQEAKGKT